MPLKAGIEMKEGGADIRSQLQLQHNFTNGGTVFVMTYSHGFPGSGLSKDGGRMEWRKNSFVFDSKL